MDEKSLFLRSLEEPAGEERSAWLDEACGSDAALRERIEALLHLHEEANSFLEAGAPGLSPTITPGDAGDKDSSDSNSSDKNAVDRAASLDAGLASAFSIEEAVVLGSANHSVLKDLGDTLHSIPRVSLRDDESHGKDPIQRPGSSEIPAQGSNSRLQLQGEIARGGMGAIIKGRDTDLGRDLAIKVLLDSHKDNPDVVQRFVEEAQIGGQLQHPGIAPIYELGQFPDKRPFFAMKLVKGKTLSKLLADREDSVEERGKFIGIFAQVCQTMAYAHSRGVIHRDLKPANIMVGAFGEVQVMDWGLAKVLATGGIADEKQTRHKHSDRSIIQTMRSVGSDTPGTFGSAGSHTKMGSVMGTPAYMPPEQALGEIDQMDERADVFGLGAILCEILTSQPPYVAHDGTRVFRMASRGKLDDAFSRLDGCGADEDLIALTKHCLKLEPTERPRDAGVLADQVKEYMESVDTRLRKAELDRIEATTRAAEERKRRKVILALAASVMLAFGIAGGGWVWVKQKDAALAQANAQAEIEERVRRGQLEQQVAGELSMARTLVSVDSGELPNQSSLVRAIAAIDRAEDLLDSNDLDDAVVKEVAELKLELDQLQRDRELIAALDDCWRLEMENRIASRERDRVTSAPELAESLALDDQGQMSTAMTDEVEMEDPKAKPSEAYAAAFLAWGVDPLETSLEEMAQRLSRLPESVRASVLVSLDRWRGRLSEDKTLTQWQAASWSILQPIKLTSRGGDKLEVLDDQSVLASGENAHMGYDLTFETDATDLSGLRLEALTHDSLPKRGPGRALGVFSLSGLEVWYAPRNDPRQRRRLWFRSAVADYSYGGNTDTPLTTETWQIDAGAGKDHVAFFTPRDAPSSEDGFRITITHEDRRTGIWGDQNIGRFRWSVNSDESERSRIAWLAQVAAENDDDAWRREMRQENRRGDLVALIHRARDIDSFVNQPRIVLAQLADDLFSNSAASLLSMVEDSEHWTPFLADKWDVRSTELAGATYDPTDSVVVEPQDDGSYVVSGESFANEQLTLTGALSHVPYAIKLELIPHPNDEGSTFGRGPGGWVELVEFDAELVDAADATKKSDLVFTQVMSDLPTDRPLRHNDINDGNLRTFCPCYDGENQHAVVFICAQPAEPVKPDKESMDLRLTIKTGGAHRHLARFRLSVLTNPVEIPNPGVVALDLMRHVQSQDANDFWTNIVASEMCLRQSVPLFTEALRYATAAVSIRPSDVGGHAFVLGALPIEDVSQEGPYGIMAKIHANRLWQLDDEHSAITKLKTSLRATASQLVEEDEKDQAISKLKFAANLPDANDAQEQLDIGIALRKLEEFELAFKTLQLVIDRYPKQPFVYNIFANGYRESGDFANAEKMYRKEIELHPDDAGVTYSNLSVLVAKRDLDEAIDLCRRGLQSSPEDARIQARLGQHLSERGDPDKGDLEEAVIYYRKAIEKDETRFSYLLDLATVLAELDQEDEAIKLRKKAIDLSTKGNGSASDLNSLAWTLLTAEDETLRDPERALVLATRSVQLDPTWAARNTLGVAHYRNGNFRDVVKVLNISTELDTQTIYDAFFLAMSHWHLDQKDEARDWYGKADEWMDEHETEDVELFRFRTEAETLLGINAEPAKKSGPEK